MNPSRLLHHFRQVQRHLQWQRLSRQALALWSIAWIAGTLAWVTSSTPDVVGPRVRGVVAGTLLAGGIGILLWNRRHPISLRQAAYRIEAAHPETDGLARTAIQLLEQPADPTPPLLRRKLLRQAARVAETQGWLETPPTSSQLQPLHAVHGLLALSTLALLVLVPSPTPAPALQNSGLALPWEADDKASVSILPGDAELERGANLVVLARFGGRVPASVALVLQGGTPQEEVRPMVRNLEDPVFGVTVTDVQKDFVYHVRHGEARTSTYRVTVFDPPRLARANAALTFPGYTGQSPRELEDTRRLTAVEGSRLTLTLQFNQPMEAVILRDRATGDIFARWTDPTPSARVEWPEWILDTDRSLAIEMRTPRGRTNTTPERFSWSVLTNQVPEIRLTAPSGDQRPSPIEEMRIGGSVRDDFGVLRHGIALVRGGRPAQYLELGSGLPGQQKAPFEHLVDLEPLGLEPDQLIAWFAWADDFGPDGKERRTSTDLFFAEIRPFDEVFREGENRGESGPQEAGGMEGGGGGGPAGQLLEQQRQILTATWNIQRRVQSGNIDGNGSWIGDADVVRTSQGEVLDTARAQADEAMDPRSMEAWERATTAMRTAEALLAAAAGGDAQALADALVAEQEAYEALLPLQARETSVARGQNQGRPGNPRQAGSQRQRQIDQLELQQSENRYETTREAQSGLSPERREQLQALNRLQELARRQQDINEQLKELQTALQAASAEEREEARRRLRRLEEEQRRMVEDVDELRERMARSENASALDNPRQQLEDTRDAVQRSADAAAEGSVSQALAEGTRAQRDLQDMRDELRRDTSGEFGDALRALRQESRDLTRQQEALEEQLRAWDQGRRRALSDSELREPLAEALEEQRQRFAQWVDDATALAEQAESVEPLLHRALYDTVRSIQQGEAGVAKNFQESLMDAGLMNRDLFESLERAAEQGSGQSLAVASEMVRRGFLEPAQSAQEQARSFIRQAREGVEAAANRLLGDDAEALRLAQAELEGLTRDLQTELERERGRSAPSTSPGDRPDTPGATPRPRLAQDTDAASSGDPGSAPGQAQAAAQARQGAEGTEGSPTPSGAGGERGPSERSTDPGEQAASAQARQGSAPDRETSPSSRQTASANEGEGSQPGRTGQAAQAGQAGGGGRPGPGGLRLDDAFDLGDGLPGTPGGTRASSGNRGPLTTDGFGPWSDRLREVEELIDQPDLQSQVAVARERARQIRQEVRRLGGKPDWAVVELEVLRPLVEVRTQLREEWLRRTPSEALVPIDRDPVPARFSESVRRYYERLGGAE